MLSGSSRAGGLAGRPYKVWRAARRLQQKLNLMPAHVLGVRTPLPRYLPMPPSADAPLGT